MAPWIDVVGMTVLRWLPAVVLVSYAAGVVDLDVSVELVWNAIRSTTFFQQPMAEGYVAAFGFLGWIILFSLADALPGLARYRMARFNQDTKPAHLVLIALALIWATFLAIGKPFGRVMPFFVLSMCLICSFVAGSMIVLRTNKGMIFYTIRAYLQFMGYLAGIALLHTLKDPAPANTGAITFGRLSVEVASGIVAYDFLFSWIHYAMHVFKVQLSGHHQHHEIAEFANPTRVLAADTVNHAPVDFLLQVAVNVFVQNIPIFGAPKHKLARFLHNIVVTGLLVESHAGYDGFWSTHRLFPGIFGGAVRHVEHHTKGKHFYQQFFCYLDDKVFN
jgi:sterol desaturase/sphingolipid hydroxylase (fatty acid hydroxylase superfamily)